MLILLSPSKTLDFETKVSALATQPDFLDDSQALIGQLRKLTLKDVSKLMDISDKLSELNVGRYRDFSVPFTPQNAKPAAYAFLGDVYDGLDFSSFSPAQVKNAQAHLRILSGLYGLLRPLDLIQPYRLEMGTALKNPRGKNLYEFWGERITEALNHTLAEQGETLVCNLASNEYWKAVKPKKLQAEVVTPVFKEYKNGSYKVVMLYAKRARGFMARYLLTNRISDKKGIQSFAGEGYHFEPGLSKGNEWVFVR